MRILSLVVAGVLALSFSAPVAPVWASTGATIGDIKTPAKRGESKAKPGPSSERPKSAKSSASKPGAKASDSNLGSAARRELLKNRVQGTKGKSAALKGKPKVKS